MNKRLFKLMKHPWKVAMAMHVFLYRRSNGAIGGRDRNMPILLLTTTGRKTGKRRTRPVMYLQDGPNYVIVASNAGMDSHPAWFWNLRHNPRVMIEVGDVKMAALAELPSSAERERLWSHLIAKAPFYADYQRRTTREIPIVILRSVSSDAALLDSQAQADTPTRM